MANEPFDPQSGFRYQPADPRTQQELGGVLERAFAHEGGRDLNEEEVRRLNALADEALLQAEAKLSLARDAEAAVQSAVERYGRSPNADELTEIERWTETAELYKREARELREKADELREHIV